MISARPDPDSPLIKPPLLSLPPFGEHPRVLLELGLGLVDVAVHAVGHGLDLVEGRGLHAPRGPASAATQRATQRSSSRAPAPEVASECGSLEECELEARELQDAARSLFAQAADLRTEARRDEITLHKQTVERASNNIIELALLEGAAL